MADYGSMIEQLFSLHGRVAMVTGASSGFGVHFARILSQAGAKVVLAARRLERLESLHEEISGAGGQSMVVPMDVTDRQSMLAGFDAAEQQWGLCDLVINNAGVSNGLARFLDITPDDWEFVHRVNLDGAFQVAQEAARRIVAREREGVIVNIASMYGVSTGIQQAVYNVSKAAVVQLTRNMALELGRKGVRVNALCPGYFPTEINEGAFDDEKGQAYLQSLLPRRQGRMEELTGPLLLLCSQAGSYINGSALVVDGGSTIKSV